MEKKQKEKPNETLELYNFVKCYNKNVLQQIKSSICLKEKSSKYVKESPLLIIQNTIAKLSEQAHTDLIDMIELLIDKMRRNYKSHGSMNCFINNVIDKQCD